MPPRLAATHRHPVLWAMLEAPIVGLVPPVKASAPQEQLLLLGSKHQRSLKAPAGHPAAR